MNTDAFFCIGKTHQFCQDFADVSKNKIVVCDGCSGAKESHIGALLLSRAAELTPFANPTQFTEETILKASEFANALHLPHDALSATLLMAIAQNDTFKTIVVGDGVIAVRNRTTKRWEVTEFAYNNETPYYLRYSLDKQLEEFYFKHCGAEVAISTYHLDQTGFEQKKCFETTHYREFPLEIYDTVALLSDSIFKFYQPIKNETSAKLEPIPSQKILLEVLNFKNFTGEFVQRRCKKAFEEFHRLNWLNHDDFSLAAMYDEGKQGETIREKEA